MTDRIVVSGLQSAHDILKCMVDSGVMKADAVDQSKLESKGMKAVMPFVAAENGLITVGNSVNTIDKPGPSHIEEVAHIIAPVGKTQAAHDCVAKRRPSVTFQR